MKIDVRRPHTTRKERRALAHQAFKKKCEDYNYEYIFHWDQGGRGSQMKGYDWNIGNTAWSDNHPIKGCTSSAIAYAKHGMEYDI